MYAITKKFRNSDRRLWIRSGLIVYLFVHLGVVEHGDELLHEALAGDLLVERRAASVHKDIDEAEGEEDHAQLSHRQSTQNAVWHYLGTMKSG